MYAHTKDLNKYVKLKTDANTLDDGDVCKYPEDALEAYFQRTTKSFIELENYYLKNLQPEKTLLLVAMHGVGI